MTSSERKLKRKLNLSGLVEKVESGAESGSRSRTSFRTTDLKSAFTLVTDAKGVFTDNAVRFRQGAVTKNTSQAQRPS